MPHVYLHTVQMRGRAFYVVGCIIKLKKNRRGVPIYWARAVSSFIVIERWEHPRLKRNCQCCGSETSRIRIFPSRIQPGTIHYVFIKKIPPV
jgi:hypothetical protein